MAEYEVIDKNVAERAIAAFDGIKEAIEDMGIEVGNEPVEEYPNKIREISRESNIAWLPNISEEGDISWERSDTTTPPESRNIRGYDATINGERAIKVVDGANTTVKMADGKMQIAAEKTGVA